jgi:hypothetical protein
MSGWIFLGVFNAVIADLGTNHGAYTRAVFLAARQVLSAVGLV